MSSVWEGSKTEAFVQGVALGVEREQRRIIHILHKQHKPEHIELPSGVCRACRIWQEIVQVSNDIKGENE
jgi:hypothetical protein